MPQRLPDLNEPRMQALLDHLKDPRPLQVLKRVRSQWMLRGLAVASASDIMAGSDFFALTDIHAYTFAEVRFTKAHLAVLGHA